MRQLLLVGCLFGCSSGCGRNAANVATTTDPGRIRAVNSGLVELLYDGSLFYVPEGVISFAPAGSGYAFTVKMLRGKECRGTVDADGNVKGVDDPTVCGLVGEAAAGLRKMNPVAEPRPLPQLAAGWEVVNYISHLDDRTGSLAARRRLGGSTYLCLIRFWHKEAGAEISVWDLDRDGTLKSFGVFEVAGDGRGVRAVQVVPDGARDLLTDYARSAVPQAAAAKKAAGY